MSETEAAAPGRRQLKKQQTAEDIVAVAAKLFSEVGYERARIDDIARVAGVSAGTVYNYFGTKGILLMAVAGAGMEHVLLQAGGELDLDASNDVDVLMPVIDVYVGEMAGLGRGLLKVLIRAGFDPSTTEILSDLIRLDEAAVAQLEYALGRMQECGRVSSDVDADSAAVLIYSLLATALVWYVSVEEMDIATLKTVLRDQIALVFNGIAVR